MVKKLFFKVPILLNIETNYACHRKEKLFMSDLVTSGLHEKIMIC